MSPSQLSEFLGFTIKNRFPVMIKGKPGIGKSDIVAQACDAAGAHLIISHPVVSDPTDYKGLPFPDKDDGTAHFLPFGELNEIIHAKTPTVYFLDDLGQAPASVQAAVMQLILARRINGHKVSPEVCFIAATNRREDKANVQGLLEPVKSRFASIVSLDVNTDDWVRWAIMNGMPVELIAFVRFRPDILEKFEATKDIINSPSPRTVSNVGKMQLANLPKSMEFEAFTGAAGESFAAEYVGFLDIFRALPDIDGILADPDGAKVPTAANVQYALCGALGARMNEQTMAPIVKYTKRLPTEIGVACVKDGLMRAKALGKEDSIKNTKAFVTWAAANANVIL